MSLQGTIIRLEGGMIGFEYRSPFQDEPKLSRNVWPLTMGWRTRGMTWRGAEEAIGRAATMTDGRVSCYLGDGCYLESTLEHNGATRSAFSEVIDIPCPKVRKGIETRYHDGRWQKYSKRQGWIAA